MWEEQSNETKSATGQTVNSNSTEAAKPSWKQAFAPQADGIAKQVMVTQCNKFDTVYNMRMKMQFSFFGLATLMYAGFYAICMHKNDAGIAFCFFIAATVVYFFESMKRLKLKIKKGSVFYLVAMELLAVSTFCTDDSRIILLNKTGIFLLTISLLLRQFYDTNGWGLGKYLVSIVYTIFGSMEELDQPFHDGAAALRNGNREKKNLWNAFLGVVLAIPLLAVVIGLLSSADIFFARLTTLMVDDMDTSGGFWLIARVLLMFFGTYILFAFLCRQRIQKEVQEHRNGEPVTAITIAGLLTAVYLLFSGIQIFGLFLGKLQLPQEYTYSEYAREGFFQLLAVGVLNLVLVLVFLNYTRESKVLKGVLTVMSACTYIMIASSAMRILMYIDAYKLTFSRIMVLWTLALLAVLFAGVMIRIFRKDFRLFRYSVVAVTVLYLGLSFAHPDYLIANVNVEREKVDYGLLSSLSADAAPALIPYFRNEADKTDRYVEDCEQRYIFRMQALKERLDIRTFNVSRYLAGQACDAYAQKVPEDGTETVAAETALVVEKLQGEQGKGRSFSQNEQVVLGSFLPTGE